jgi:hypothetical protein
MLSRSHLVHPFSRPLFCDKAGKEIMKSRGRAIAIDLIQGDFTRQFNDSYDLRRRLAAK